MHEGAPAVLNIIIPVPYNNILLCCIFQIGFSDIDECASGTDNCDANAVCTNTHGSFTCTCRSGYSGDGDTCTGKPCMHINRI